MSRLEKFLRKPLLRLQGRRRRLMLTRRDVLGGAALLGVAAAATQLLVFLARRLEKVDRRAGAGPNQDAVAVAQKQAFDAATQAPETAERLARIPPETTVLRVDSLQGGDRGQLEDAPLGSPLLEASVETAVRRLVGTETVEEAYRSLFTADDIIGVKVGVIGWGLAVGFVRSLLRAHHDPTRVIIFDLPCTAGWSPPVSAELKAAGVIFDHDLRPNEPHTIGTLDMALASGLVRCTALVNVGGMNAHEGTVYTGVLKNHMGAIESPDKLHTSFEYSCALLNSLPPICDRTRLVLLDALRPCLKGYPDFPQQRYYWPARRILAGRDPVATDVVGLDLIREGLASTDLEVDLTYAEETLERAARLGLGIADRDRIEVVSV